MTPFKLTLSLHPFSIVRLTSYSGYASLMVDPVHRSRLVSTQKVDAKNDARLSEVGGSGGRPGFRPCQVLQSRYTAQKDTKPFDGTEQTRKAYW